MPATKLDSIVRDLAILGMKIEQLILAEPVGSSTYTALDYANLRIAAAYESLNDEANQLEKWAKLQGENNECQEP